MAKCNIGLKGFTLLPLPDLRPLFRDVRSRDQGRNLEAGIAVQAKKEQCLLACSHSFLGLHYIYSR